MNDQPPPTELSNEQQQPAPATCPVCKGGGNFIKALIIIVCLGAAGIVTYNSMDTGPGVNYGPTAGESGAAHRTQMIEQPPADGTAAMEKPAANNEDAADEAVERVESAEDEVMNKPEEPVASPALDTPASN